MRPFSKSNVATIAIVTGIVVASGTGGAVAGAMITGKQIKDGTVTTADIRDGGLTGTDVKNGSIRTSDLASSTRGLFLKIGPPNLVTELSDPIAAGSEGSVQTNCPSGQLPVSGSAVWNNTGQPVGAYPFSPLFTWFASGTNPSASNDRIFISIVCVKVG